MRPAPPYTLTRIEDRRTVRQRARAARQVRGLAIVIHSVALRMSKIAMCIDSPWLFEVGGTLEQCADDLYAACRHSVPDRLPVHL